MRLKIPAHLAIILVGLLLARETACGFEFFPSRYQLTRLTKERLDISADYAVCIYRPNSVAMDNFVFASTLNKPYLSGNWSNLVLYNRDGRVTDQMNFRFKLKLVDGRDIDGDGTEELVVSFAGDTACGLAVYEWPDRNLISEYQMLERDYRWRNTDVWETILLIGPAIQRSDSTPMLLLNVGAGHGKMPKGLLVVNPETGKEVWHYWIAGAGGIEKGAVIKSPALEIPLYVFGTYGGANGSVWKDTNDETAYLCAVDLYGNEVWRWERPGPFTGLDEISAYTDTRSERPSVFVLYRCVGSAAAESLFCVDAGSGEILRRRELSTHSSDSHCLGWNVSAEGAHEFLVWNAMDGIGVYDEELNLVNRLSDYDRVLGMCDLDQDGRLELAVQARNRNLVLLDDDFTRLASFPVFAADGYARFQWTRSSQFPFVYILSKDDVSRFSLARTPQYWLQLSLRITVLLLAFTFLSWISVWGIRARLTVVRERRDRERRLAWATITSKLSHDIRTPISVLRLSGDNLEMEIEAEFGRVPEHIRKYFDVIRAETARTEDVANGLLKFSRELPPVREQVDLAALVRKTVEQHPHSPQIEVVTDVEPDFPMVTVDYRQMVSLIENLMSNSLKAMKNTGRLTVSLRQAQLLLKKKARNGFEIEVADTGRGIPPKDLPRIFEAYFSHSEGGTGLGLAIVKKIVEDHHGTISVRSTVGVGTTVTARIPFEQEAADEPAR